MVTVGAQQVTLRDEIAFILRTRGSAWMTTQAIADEVNRRGRYHQRDGQRGIRVPEALLRPGVWHSGYIRARSTWG
jgi:hypothetical protein